MFFVAICSLSVVYAQQKTDQEYWNVVQQRAQKILEPIKFEDTLKLNRVRDLIADEYVAIKRLDEKKEQALAQAKTASGSREKLERATEKINKQDLADRKLLNTRYLKSLGKELTNAQIETVANGMTYYVLPKTYQAHLEMIPTLKEEEKKYIYDALLEARYLALTAGSSDAKHAWFGKYKGRINNYLSARGYDLKKEREAWNARIKASKQ
ncbi:DUF3826 domain-containing protein [Niabella terrae]